MQYPLIPFSNDLKNKSQFHLEKFTEMEQPFHILSEKNVDYFPKIVNNYKFGLIDKLGNYFWFFNGVATVNDRVKAIEVFNALLGYCNENNLGVPFAYKEL